MFNKGTLILVFIFFTLCSYSQANLVFTQSVPLTKKSSKAYKELASWFDGQTRFRNLTTANDQNIIKGTGVISYRNPIKYQESSALSREYQNKTNGNFSYEIIIEVKDGECVFKLQNFKHEPDDKIDNFNFGFITNADKIPSNIFCEVTPEWCNNVWLDMRSRIEQQVNAIFLSLPKDL